MSSLDALYVVLGTVQAAATLAALYYAWRAVRESHSAERERRREARSSRLARVVETLHDLDQATRGANSFTSTHHQRRLQMALVGLDLPLPKTHLAATTPNIGTLDVQVGFQHVAAEAFAELAEAGEYFEPDLPAALVTPRLAKAALALSGMLVLAVAGLATYVVTAEDDDERALALSAAHQIACSGSGACSDVTHLERVADGVWTFRAGDRCITLTLARFQVSDNGQRIDGASQSACGSE